MIRAAVVFAALLVLAAAGAALDVGGHRLRHRYRCWRSGRRTVRAWRRTRRERAAQDLATCEALWGLAATQHPDKEDR